MSPPGHYQRPARDSSNLSAPPAIRQQDAPDARRTGHPRDTEDDDVIHNNGPRQRRFLSSATVPLVRSNMAPCHVLSAARDLDYYVGTLSSPHTRRCTPPALKLPGRPDASVALPDVAKMPRMDSNTGRTSRQGPGYTKNGLNAHANPPPCPQHEVECPKAHAVPRGREL